MSNRFCCSTVLVSLCAVLTWNLASVSELASRVARAQPPDRGQSVQSALSGGAPAARREIDSAIARAGALDLASACLSLSTSIEDYNLACAGTETDMAGPRSSFLRVMADRRVARIHELLTALSPSDAEQFLIEQFNADLARSRDELARWLEDPAGTRPGIAMNFHALSAELFLCSQFCELPALLGAIDRWNEVMGPIADAAAASENAGIAFIGSEYARPQAILLVNLYLTCLQRHNSLSEQAVDAAMGLGMGRLRNLVFSRWDAHTSQFDFTHTRRGVPVDLSKSIATYRVTYMFQGQALHDAAAQARLVDYWRAVATASIKGPDSER